MPELDLQPLASNAEAEPKPQRQRKAAGKSAAAQRADRRADRRREGRQKGPRQVWIQGTDPNGAGFEEVQIMRDYSHGGFYFVTSLHCYRTGVRLHVIPSFGSLNLEFVAEVVRVEPKPGMSYGVGVKLLHAKDPIAPQNSRKL